MIIMGVKHKGLRRLLRNDDTSGLPTPYVNKIRNIIAFLQDMQNVDELYTVPTWKAHVLSGQRKGTWSLFVSRNWRITFRVNDTEIEIIELNYEDYH